MSARSHTVRTRAEFVAGQGGAAALTLTAAARALWSSGAAAEMLTTPYLVPPVRREGGTVRPRRSVAIVVSGVDHLAGFGATVDSARVIGMLGGALASAATAANMRTAWLVLASTTPETLIAVRERFAESGVSERGVGFFGVPDAGTQDVLAMLRRVRRIAREEEPGEKEATASFVSVLGCDLDSQPHSHIAVNTALCSSIATRELRYQHCALLPPNAAPDEVLTARREQSRVDFMNAPFGMAVATAAGYGAVLADSHNPGVLSRHELLQLPATQRAVAIGVCAALAQLLDLRL